MGSIHNALTRGPLSGALTNALGDTKGIGGLERYGETLTPTIDLWSEPEWAFLRGEFLVARRLTVGAVVAEFSAAAVVNPAGSESLVVVERLTAAAAVALTYEIDAATEAQVVATLTVGAQGLARDRRANVGATYSTRATTYTGSDPASFIGQAYERIAESAVNVPAPSRTALPIVLPPGEAIVVIGQVVNTAIVVCFSWRERRAFAGELV